MSRALLDHFLRMQTCVGNYLPPESYTPQFGEKAGVDALNGEDKERAFIGDMIWALDGPEQRAAQAEAEFDYVAETEVTASGMDGRHNVGVTEFRAALVDVIRAAETMDQFKKVLFRDRSRGQAGLKATVTLDGMLDSKISKTDLDLLHGIVGVITESGELAEVLLKKLAHEQPFDRTNVREEIGDVLWYLARLVKWAGTSFYDEMVRNINCNLAQERAVLEGGAPVKKPEPQFPDDPYCSDA